LTLPTNSTQARELGRDFDNDGEGDNRLGQFFASLSSQGLSFQDTLSTAIADGDLLMLHSLKTPSFAKAKDASWQVLYAVPTEAPDFSGDGSFTVASAAPQSPKLPAKIKNQKVKTSARTIPVRLDLGNGIFDLELEMGKVFATCSKLNCSDGRINGGITAEELDAGLIPELADLLTLLVSRDCPGPGPASCTTDSEGKTVQSLFDENDDLVITEDEVRENPLTQSLLALDLDLEKANGKPGQDGVEDALSFGLGFDAVRAQLIRP
jgi:hypothetical protein